MVVVRDRNLLLKPKLCLQSATFLSENLGVKILKHKYVTILEVISAKILGAKQQKIWG